ncbi:MAG: ABC transporter substrate-binding protein [Austwickia sp.]|nr:ABC transporter substrate-binding protein [Austwickia sp.]
MKRVNRQLNRRTALTILTTAAAAAALSLAGCAAGGPANGGTGSASPGSSGASGASTPAAQGSATLGLTYIPNIQFGPFYVGLEKKTFEARGVNLTLRHHGSNEGLFTALAAGQEDFVIAGGDELLQARAEGMDLVAISSYYRTYPVVLIVRDESPIKTTKDLRGHSIGLPGRYGESWFGLQVALKDAGLTEKDVRITEVGYTQQAALTTDKVDAIVGFSNNDAVQFGLAGVKTRTIPLARNVPLVSISLVTTAKLLKDRPNLARSVAEGMLDGIEAVKADPEGAITISTGQVPGLAQEQAAAAARVTLAATLKIMVDAQGKVAGKLDPAQWQDMAEFMTAQGLLTKPVDPAVAMSTEYVSR